MKAGRRNRPENTGETQHWPSESQGDGLRSEARILLGEVVGAVGIRGQVRIKSYCEPLEALGSYGHLTTDQGMKILLDHVRPTSKGHLIARIIGISSRQQAESLRGARLYADRSNLPVPGENEYYVADLQGLQAFDKYGNPIGRVIGANNFGAGDIVDIALQNSDKSVFVAFDRESVVSIEIENGRIVLDLPDGAL